MLKKKIDFYDIKYKNSMEPIDWSYYTKYYPRKAKAIQELRLDTGLGLAEAKKVVDEIFLRIENGEVTQRDANAANIHDRTQEAREEAKEGIKNVGKSTGCCLFAGIYIFFGTISNLVKRY